MYSKEAVNALKLAIKKEGLTQEEFAYFLGIKRNTLAKRFRGDLEFKKLEKEIIKEKYNIDL